MELATESTADDGAALVFAGTSLLECVASRAGARVMAVEPDGAGGVSESPRPVRLLAGAERADPVCLLGLFGELSVVSSWT